MIQDAIKAITGISISSDGFHTIISSLVINPFQEYIGDSQHKPYFIRLSPILERIDHMSWDGIDLELGWNRPRAGREST